MNLINCSTVKNSKQIHFQRVYKCLNRYISRNFWRRCSVNRISNRKMQSSPATQRRILILTIVLVALRVQNVDSVSSASKLKLYEISWKFIRRLNSPNSNIR